MTIREWSKLLVAVLFVAGCAGMEPGPSPEVKHALAPTGVRAKTAADLYAMVGQGKADVISTGKTGLFSVAEKEPGSKVLDGRILVDHSAMGIPKGRGAPAADYVDRFVESAKAAGLVKAAIEKAALRGVVVAPRKQ